MCRQLMHLLLSVMVLGLVLGSAAQAGSLLTDPAIIGWWECNEGQGSVVGDSSPNGNHGAFVNGNPVWVAGAHDGAVELTGPTLVEIPAVGQSLTEATMAGWMKPYGAQPEWASFIMHRGSGSAHGFNILGFQLAYHWVDNANTWSYRGGDNIVDNEWSHAALTITPTAATFYVNGVQGSTNSVSHAAANWDQPYHLGGDGGANWVGRRMIGALDDVCFFSRALSPDEIVQLLEGAQDPALASDPSPADEAMNVPLDVVLSWSPGENAPATNGHKLYFGEVFDDVNNGDPSTDRGVLSAPTFSVANLPFALEYGKVYYWRVDEADGANWLKGDVWSFTAEFYTYPITGVVATSNTTPNQGQVPANVVNGSGLNANGQHSNDTAHMWAGTAPAGEAAYIQFEFDKAYKLHEMLVWNYNMAFEIFLGVGLKNVTIDYSVDGDAWTVLGDYTLAQGSGANTYAANTTVAFDDVAAKYVRLTVISGYGNSGMYGLSEVRFLSIPAHAREPQPANGAVNVDVTTALNWRTGRDAVSHDVSLSTDPNALVLLGTTAQTSYDPGALVLDSAYSWRIDENDGATTWVGDTWSFTTQEYLVIDDFEAYSDDWEAGEAIWQGWVDGFENPANGSQVGYLTSPFAEQAVVHTGKQAMPLFFNNASAAAISEADTTLSPAQNWTVSGIQTLSLWFHGSVENTGQLYVKINGAKVVYDGAATDLSSPTWQTWNIALADVGTNLSSVSTVTVGVQGAGSGVVYIDDIRLYARTGELIQPVQPDSAGLVLNYTLDAGAGSTAADASGNGNTGTIVGNPVWTTGVSGGALEFAGLGDYISTDKALLDSLPEFTIACWIQGDFSTANRVGLIGQNDCVEYGFNAASSLQLWTPGGGAATGNWPYDASDWHSVIAVGNGTNITVYVDARPLVVGGSPVDPTYGSSTYKVNMCGGGVFDATGNWYTGLIDEIRIYHRALSPAEVAGLSGRTEPLHAEL